MGQAGGHDDAATETHHTGEDLGQPRVAIRLLLTDPASSHRHHRNEANDPGGEAEYKHRHYLGGQEVTFHPAAATVPSEEN